MLCPTIALILLLKVGLCFAEGFRLAHYYQNNMVLQREPYNSILWGYCDENDAIVTVSLLDMEYRAKPIATSRSDSRIWKVKLDPIGASVKPINIKITQTTRSGLVSSLELKDVMFGDVWCCLGQSNMEMELYKTHDWKKELSYASSLTKLRLLQLNPEKKSDKNHSIPELEDTISAPRYSW